jgi:hypothetical protein
MEQATQEWRAQLWDLLVELRREILESQKIRAQVIGFKITFIGTGVGLILANQSRIPLTLLVIPAFAAIFFDFLIQSYSFSIKRLGHYCCEYLEPAIFKHHLSDQFVPWEEFMSRKENRQRYSAMGNLGITTLTVIPAVVVLFLPFRSLIAVPLLAALVFFLAVDIISFSRTKQFSTQQKAVGKKALP